MPCDKTILLWTLGVAVLALIVVGVWMVFMGGPPAEHFEALKATNALANKDAELVYFWGKWCPHCTTFMPVWNQLEEKLKAMGINYRKVEDNSPLVKGANVAGFPCVRWYPKGLADKDNYVQFSDKRTVDALLNFVKTNK